MTNYDFIEQYVMDATKKAVHDHMFTANGELVHYSTTICTISGNIAKVNISKISRTTSKLQSYLIRLLRSHGYTIEEYDGGINGYFWNYGYMGAPNWTAKELKQRGIF